jgi:hypothetical protein
MEIKKEDTKDKLNNVQPQKRSRAKSTTPSKAELFAENEKLKLQQKESFGLEQIKMIRSGIFVTIQGFSGLLVTEVKDELVKAFDDSLLLVVNKHSASLGQYAVEIQLALATGLIVIDAVKITKEKKVQGQKPDKNKQIKKVVKDNE